MAKKDKKEEDGQVQEPEAPKKKPKEKGEFGVVALFGVVVGSFVILFILAAIFWFMLVKPTIAPSQSEKDKKEHAEKEKKHNPDAELEEFLSNKKLQKIIQTGRITTNPKNSTQFIVADFAIELVAKDEKILKEAFEGEGKKEGEGESNKLMIMIKGTCNRILGSMTVDELQMKRDSIPSLLKKDLKPIFAENELFLRNVIMQEFILQ